MAITFEQLLENAKFFEWIPMVLLIFAIVYLILGLWYMLSKMFSRPDWEARAKVEMTRMIVSGLMIIGIAGFATVIAMATYALAEDANPFDVSREFIGGLAMNDLPTQVSKLWESSREARIESSINKPMPSCTAGACFTEHAGHVYIANNLEMIATVVIPFSASLVVQLLVLDVIRQFFLSLLLPAGFILKIAPVTRDSGAFLISLALAFYFVFPMVYVAGSLMHKEVGTKVKGELERMVSSSKLGDAYDFDNGRSLKAVAALAYLGPFAMTIPLLAVILSIAAARSLFPVFSKDFVDEVNM